MPLFLFAIAILICGISEKAIIATIFGAMGSASLLTMMINFIKALLKEDVLGIVRKRITRKIKDGDVYISNINTFGCMKDSEGHIVVGLEKNGYTFVSKDDLNYILDDFDKLEYHDKISIIKIEDFSLTGKPKNYYALWGR